jgi:hypothetical protein
MEIKASDSRGLYQFICYNPEILEEKYIRFLHGLGVDAVEKGANNYARACFHHWRVIQDCLPPIGPFRFFQAMMGLDCDATRAFKQGVVEEFAEVWITLSRLGRLESSVLPLRELECEDPDVELGCWEY